MNAEYNDKWRFTDRDLQVGHGTHDYERKFLGITDPLTPKGVFPAFVYSILSAAQNTLQLVRVFDQIRRNDLMDPDALIAADEAKIKNLLSTTHFPNQKFKRFLAFRDWWVQEESNHLILEICENSKQGGLAHTRNLRNRLATAECAGVGYKVASFILQLSIKDPKRINIVVIDKWVLTFLGDIGFAVKAPDYKTISGLQNQHYLDYEVILSSMAAGLKLSPAQFGLMIWCKQAYFEPNRYLADFLVHRGV